MVKPTLKDIADYVGVSISTVSKALNNSKEINEKTIKKIREAAIKLNYNNISVEKNVTRAIGVILPEVTSYVYSNILENLEKKFQEHGYDLLLGIHSFDWNKIEKFVKLFSSKKLDAIFIINDSGNIMEVQLKRIISVCDNCKIPLFIIESSMGNSFDYNCNALFLDDSYAVDTIIKSLVEYGHNDFGLIFDKLDNNRLEVVKTVLSRYGMKKLPENRVYITEKRNEEAGVTGMEYFLSQKSIPTAFIASYDEICIGALKHAYDRGLTSPNDFSIFSFDNTRISEYVFNGITTVQIPIKKVVDIAVSTVMNEIKNGIDNTKIVTKVTSEAVIRNTTGKK